MSEPTLPPAAACPDGIRCPTMGCDLDHDAFRAKRQRIREAGEVTTEVRLLALPSEPPVGSEVETRAADGYREGGWVRVDDPRTHPDYRSRCWAPANNQGARSIHRLSWREVCEYAVRYGCELWLTREGPAPTTEEPA